VVCQGQPRIFTLWDLMRPFRVHALFSDIRTLLHIANEAKGEDGEISQDYKDNLIPLLENLHRKMEEGGFPLSDIQLQRMLAYIKSEGSTYQYVARTCEEISQRLEDECTAFAVFAIEPDKKTWLMQPALFGETVTSSFPSAAFDIEEAGNCYAFARSTACVFHLMRVMEVGLRSLGKALRDPRFDPKTNPTWEAILRRCDEELAKPIAQRSPDWKTNDAFFSEATANLRAVKNAWRNPTMHIETVYDPDKALDVLNAVKGFMRHLSEKLKE
jgi:hypothetical protein